MASSQILSQTLSSITTIKLSQLRTQKTEYESRKRSLLEDVASETDTRKRAKLLLAGSEKLPTMAANPTVSLANLARFVQQAERDPAVGEYFLRDYEATLRGDLEVQSNKYEFASLYGKLVEEWTSAGGEADEDEGDGFEAVGREEMHEQRKTWEGYVFTPKETDPAAIKAYLEGIFKAGSKDVRRAYDALVESVKHFQEFGIGQGTTHFDEDSVSTCIRGMLRSDVLSDEKRATLRDFLGNKVVLSEIADVLNMRMATRASWGWGEPQVVEQRRNLNGRYRFYPDEDLLHAIFIYYVGRRFAVHLREALLEFVGAEGVWRPDAEPISKEDVHRRKYFLTVEVAPSRTVEGKREKHFTGEVFLDQLPAAMEEVRGSYGDDKSEAEDTRKGHVQVTQELLHMIETEVILRRKLGRDMVVLRSDFKWFGPSIPHSSIFAVLEFLGVEAEWLDFFRRVLEAPLRFAQDPADAEPQTRRRGTPLSTPLADYFGESLLFVLDFAVNQRAGTRLYRLHDDMWLWGDVETCAAGWEAMVQFAEVTGLDFNMEKTGSAIMVRKDREVGPVVERLPKGDVTWGFLKVDPENGRFVIDQGEVDKHIAELKLQLDACRTVFDWIQAWNVYGVRFFTNNFGRPAHCYGRAHVDSMLATFERIQKTLFGAESGGAGDHLKKMVSSRFGVRDLPDGYLYFPVAMGGLGLQNPFVKLYLIRDQTVEDPEKLVDEFLEDEEAEYRRAKERFEDKGAAVWMGSEWDDLRGQEFMSHEEYVRYRERTSALLLNTYNRLMAEPVARDVELRGEVKAALEEEEWYALSGYDRWVVQLFCKDMIARFGGLNVVDKGLLPMGLMTMLRESRFKWQG
ncbi:hypothetical protein CONLIGDRAFT_367409 [Coniochaeta ligniaria NRRL 30616]|uniref:Reverse transcriptase domain-containing protein n=1 Tax=Coniochaeta ligniaria NRRL 30616 TaxID=1408157 RepID=A0A1J7JRJ4_9PEZI|nr:hypothetical protein CONLIGDRAFT_367409 [Coniochaeta ligniaria NRRL 30616]